MREKKKRKKSQRQINHERLMKQLMEYCQKSSNGCKLFEVDEQGNEREITPKR